MRRRIVQHLCLGELLQHQVAVEVRPVVGETMVVPSLNVLFLEEVEELAGARLFVVRREDFVERFVVLLTAQGTVRHTAHDVLEHLTVPN